MPLRPRWLTAAAFLSFAGLRAIAPAEADAQGCSWVDPTRSVQVFTIPGQGQVVHLGGPSIRCSDGVRFSADSAVAYPSQSMTHLMGRVRFRDGATELTSDEARYFSRQGRLQANGHVVLRDTLQGSEIQDGDVVLLRQNDVRDADQITVTTGPDGVRPRARLYMKESPAAEAPGAPAPDSAAVLDTARAPVDTAAVSADSAAAEAEPPPRPRRERADTAKVPYVVVGDRLFLQGDQYFHASGNVEIERDSLEARADTAEYDQVAERMLLKGSARVEGGTYILWGRTINLAIRGGDVTGVRASRDAILVGEDLRLEAPLVQLFLADGAMERLVATPLPADPSTPPATAEDSAFLARPVAEAEEFRVTADSLDVLAPGEVLERIFAVGGARGESSARDSLNVPSLPELARTDWLEGDTIVATFSRPEPALEAAADTASDEYRLEELTARGSAKSLYRMLASDSTARPGVDAPAVHYVTGAAIRIVMAEGEVERMEVDGPTRGWHLEPDKAKAGSDTLARPDTTAPPDTGAVQSGTEERGKVAAEVARPGETEGAGGGAGAAGEAWPGTAQGARGRRRGSRR